MKSGDKYYFEEEFSNKKHKFSFSYDDEILNEILKNKKSGKVLDLGCGEGGLSLALAEKGFEVICVDISETAIKRIKRETKKRGLKINAICEDLDNYNILENFDVIICMGVLHFVTGARKLIDEIKGHTKVNGVNVLDLLIGDEFREGEIKKIYRDWKTLDYENHEEDVGRMGYLFAIK